MLTASIVDLVSHQTYVAHLSIDVGIRDYKSYFGMTGIGWALYLCGRVMNFISFVVETVNLQQADQNGLKDRLCLFGQEACFVLIFTGLSSSILSLIDLIVHKRSFGYYSVVMAWDVIIIICLIAIYYIGKQITPEK